MTEISVIEKKEEWAYQDERALIVPYAPGHPSDLFPEDFLVRLYFQTKHEKLMRRTFPGGSNFSLNWFISYFQSRTMLIGMVKPNEVAGYTWIYETEGDEKFRKGSIGVAFFRKYWGNTVIQDLSFLGLKWYFQEAGLNIIFSTTAAWNRSSVRFGRIMGFEHIGRAPSFFLNSGVPTDIDLGFLRREKFFEVLSARRGLE